METDLITNQKMVATMMEKPSMIEESYIPETNKSGNTYVILYIVIGICAILGIALGILAGRKSAYK